MSINNSFSLDRIKKALDLRTVAIVLLVVTVISVVFYVTIKNIDSREVLVWYVTTDTEAGFSDETLKNVNDYGIKNGIDRILLTGRHPEDRYFDVLMSTTAFYTCDAFIMQAETARKYADIGMFSALSVDGLCAENILYYDDTPIGILLENDYYFLINAKTDVDHEIIYNIFDLLKNK